ncbi:hypothetical protein ACJJI3_01905 [Microbulbifer sp. ZKSA004]|uniref:hypothetical protein n=1 Tax=Microbulbifer sp. ZKSA004 TaxID=3243389 RepID=UPI00403A0BB7
MISSNPKSWLMGLIVSEAFLAYGYSAIAYKDDDIEEPIYKITFKISPDTRSDRIETFADSNAFAIRSAPTRPNSSSSLTQFWREDIKIIGVNPFDPNIYKFRFYKNDDAPVVPESLKQLVREIKGVAKNLEGASFEEK